MFQGHILFWENCIPGPDVKCIFYCGQRSNHHAILHTRSPNDLSKTLTLSVSYFETLCAFLLLLRLKRTQTNPTMPVHKVLCHPALAFLWLHVTGFSQVHCKILKVLLPVWNAPPCPLHLLTPAYLSRFQSNITFSQEP